MKPLKNVKSQSPSRQTIENNNTPQDDAVNVQENVKVNPGPRTSTTVDGVTLATVMNQPPARQDETEDVEKESVTVNLGPRTSTTVDVETFKKKRTVASTAKNRK
jgi:hypothetical protein